MLECARSRRRKNVVLASALALVGVTPAFAGNDDPRAAMIDLEIETPDGYAFSLSLDTTQFADEDFDGSFSFVGEITSPDLTDAIAITIETSVAHVEATLGEWQDVHVDGAVLASFDERLATLTIYDNLPGNRASARVSSSQQVGGRIVAGDATLVAEPIFETPNSMSTPESIGANAWTYAATLTAGILPARFDLSVRDCGSAAEDTCGHNCGTVTDADNRGCVKSVTYNTDGGCSFECFTKAECCADD